MERALRVWATASVWAVVPARLSAFRPWPLKGRLSVSVLYRRAEAPLSALDLVFWKATGEESS